jgi:hypothetical protein
MNPPDQSTPTIAPTPRTDALQAPAPYGNYFSASASDFRDLARTLERELTETERLRFGADADRRRLRAEVERLNDCCDELHYIIDNAGYPSGKDYADMTARAEKAEAALAFIAENGGTTHETECGTISCNGLWCAEQARAAIDAARKEQP